MRWAIEPSKTLRLHLWSRAFQWTQQPNWQIHDHIFEFRSLVLMGTLLNKCYTSVPLQDRPHRVYPLYEVAYDKNESHLHHSGSFLNIRLESIERVTNGGHYAVRRGVLHRTKLASEFAISLLATSEHGPGHSPRVVGEALSEAHCFSRSAERFKPQAIAQQFIALLRTGAK
jgi:hypothetical protein